MYRRLKLIMDPNRKIKHDGETNWVTIAPTNLESTIKCMMRYNREILVIQ